METETIEIRNEVSNSLMSDGVTGVSHDIYSQENTPQQEIKLR